MFWSGLANTFIRVYTCRAMNTLRKIVLFVVNRWHRHKSFRMIVGVICIVWGIIALVTPLTPGAWLIFVGLEIFGYRILFWEKTKLWLKTKAVVWWQKRE